jgi:hypothetical protein
MKTLAEFYCEHHRVPSEQFESHLLQRCLYPRARWLKSVLNALDADYFAPDLELIRATGRLTRPGGFAAEVAEYNYDSGNSGRLRREWKLRLSVTRLRAIVLDLLGEETIATESMAPFALPAVLNAEPVLARIPVRSR